MSACNRTARMIMLKTKAIKLINLWLDQSRKKEIEITNIRNERENTTTGPAAIKWITRKFYEQLSVNNFNNLNEMEKFLDTNYQAHSRMDNLSGLKKGRENLSSTIVIKEIKL